MPCPRPFHFSYSDDYIYDCCPLTDPEVGLSIFACDVEHIRLSILVCAVASLFCDCMVSVIQELYTCLFRQMARLLLKISRCLAYAAHPAMVLRCISLSFP